MGLISSRHVRKIKAPPPRSTIRITEPTVDVVTVDEQKAWSRISAAKEEALVLSQIRGSTRDAEFYTNRGFLSQKWRITFDSFPFGLFSIPEIPQLIELPISRLITLDLVETVDTDDVVTPFATSNFHIDTNSEPGRIILRDTANWPSGLRDIDAIRIEFTVGYGTKPSEVPQGIKDAIHWLVANKFEDRERRKVNDILTALDPYRVFTL